MKIAVIPGSMSSAKDPLIDAVANGLLVCGFIAVPHLDYLAPIVGGQKTGLEEECPGFVDVTDDHLDVAVHEMMEPILGRAAGSVGIDNHTVEEPCSPSHHLNQKLVLAPDMGVDGGTQHAKLLAEVAHRRAMKSAACKQLAGGGDYILTSPCWPRDGGSGRADFDRTQSDLPPPNERSFVRCGERNDIFGALSTNSRAELLANRQMGIAGELWRNDVRGVLSDVTP